MENNILLDLKINRAYIFLLPSSAWSFLSGIFVSTAVNIFTSQIPESLLSVGLNYIIVAIGFLIVAGLMFYLSSILSDLQKQFNESPMEQEKLGRKNCWYYLLESVHVNRKLTVILGLIIFIIGLNAIILCFGG